MKSPLKSKPLRNPGESLEFQLDNLINEEMLKYFLAAALFIIIAMTDWIRWFYPSTSSPWLITVIAFIAVLVAAWKIRSLIVKARNLKLGIDGEKAVGQYLDGMIEFGAKVLHDIPGTGFNIDHIVIHRNGIYVIETKTRSKPDRGETRLVYDGAAISKAGSQPDIRPIHQVRAAKQWLAQIVKESTGRDLPVKAVVVYPGWYIESTVEARASDVWVLNPKALPSFILNSAPQITDEDVHLCAFHLKRYIRGISLGEKR